MKRTEMVKKTAKYKGFVALGSLVVTVMMFMFSWYWLIVMLPLTAYFTFRWLQYRAKWGLRF